jgi:hypothetical protein
MQTDDLNDVLAELEFDYRSSNSDSDAPNWNEISPQGRRMLVARAHSQAKNDRFA